MKRLILAIFLLGASSAYAQLSPDVSGFLRDQNGNMQRINYAFVNPVSATSTEIVAAQSTGIKIRVLSVACSPAGANLLTFKSATTAISADLQVALGQPLLLAYNPNGWFETAAAAALNVTTTTTSATGCQVAWIAVSTSPLP